MAKTKKKIIADRFQAIDLYSDNFNFVIKGNQKKTTFTGAIFSILVAIFVIFYSHQKLLELVNYDDTHIIEVVSQRVVLESDVFTSSMGLQVAFAITAYDGNTESIEDEEIGVLKAFFISWGENYVDYNEETLSLTGITEIPTRNCTGADFGLSSDWSVQENEDMLTGGNSKFYPMNKQ